MTKLFALPGQRSTFTVGTLQKQTALAHRHVTALNLISSRKHINTLDKLVPATANQSARHWLKEKLDKNVTCLFIEQTIANLSRSNLSAILSVSE